MLRSISFFSHSQNWKEEKNEKEKKKKKEMSIYVTSCKGFKALKNKL